MGVSATIHAGGWQVTRLYWPTWGWFATRVGGVRRGARGPMCPPRGRTRRPRGSTAGGRRARRAGRARHTPGNPRHQAPRPCETLVVVGAERVALGLSLPTVLLGLPGAAGGEVRPGPLRQRPKRQRDGVGNSVVDRDLAVADQVVGGLVCVVDRDEARRRGACLHGGEVEEGDGSARTEHGARMSRGLHRARDASVRSRMLPPCPPATPEPRGAPPAAPPTPPAPCRTGRPG